MLERGKERKGRQRRTGKAAMKNYEDFGFTWKVGNVTEGRKEEKRERNI